jgi:hypothetical protein
MPGDTIPDDVRDFVFRYIDSIAELEALLLLRKDSALSWDVATVAERLYIPQEAASNVLGRLHARGLLTCDGGLYRYEGIPINLASQVEAVATVYARQLIPMTNLIHSKPSRIREFADAFKFRKDS